MQATTGTSARMKSRKVILAKSVTAAEGAWTMRLRPRVATAFPAAGVAKMGGRLLVEMERGNASPLGAIRAGSSTTSALRERTPARGTTRVIFAHLCMDLAAFVSTEPWSIDDSPSMAAREPYVRARLRTVFTELEKITDIDLRVRVITTSQVPGVAGCSPASAVAPDVLLQASCGGARFPFP